MLPRVEWCKSALDVTDAADILVILTEWNEFRAFDLRRARQRMAGNVLVDLRNVYPVSVAEEAGFVYHSVGRRRPPSTMPTSKREFVRSAAKSGDISQVTR
jgi:UDPglucose 6-dehydrogenase